MIRQPVRPRPTARSASSSTRRTPARGPFLRDPCRLGLVLLGLLIPGAVPKDAGAQSMLERMRERAASRAESQTEDRAGQQVDSAVDKTVDCMFDPVECAKRAKPAEAEPPGPTETTPATDATPADAAAWYAEQDGSRVGPMPRSQLDAMVAAGRVTPATLVWREGLADWTAAGQLTELAEGFEKVPPPLPKSSGPPPLPTGAGRAAPGR